MKKAFVISMVALMALSGCINPPDDSNGDCSKFEDDVCALFDCTVDLCWCESSPDAVLFESNSPVTSEAEAMKVVETYLATNPEDELTGEMNIYEVKNAVEVNEYFYNVFAEDINGNERVFTVSKTGAIIKTVCGV